MMQAAGVAEHDWFKDDLQSTTSGACQGESTASSAD